MDAIEAVSFAAAAAPAALVVLMPPLCVFSFPFPSANKLSWRSSTASNTLLVLAEGFPAPSLSAPEDAAPKELQLCVAFVKCAEQKSSVQPLHRRGRKSVVWHREQFSWSAVFMARTKCGSFASTLREQLKIGRNFETGAFLEMKRKALPLLTPLECRIGAHFYSEELVVYSLGHPSHSTGSDFLSNRANFTRVPSIHHARQSTFTAAMPQNQCRNPPKSFAGVLPGI